MGVCVRGEEEYVSGMERYLSPLLFVPDFSNAEAPIRNSYSLTTALQLGFKEKWLQHAIMQNPELVLAPCREAGLIRHEERWLCWAKEVSLPDVGSIDILLVSDSGRIGIVETKLAYNPMPVEQWSRKCWNMPST
jgi:hypothetical protein